MQRFSTLYTYYGPRAVWLLEIAVISLMTLMWVVFYRRLVPLKIPGEMQRSKVAHSTTNSNDSGTSSCSTLSPDGSLDIATKQLTEEELIATRDVIGSCKL